jgi:hypothetical protein
MDGIFKDCIETVTQDFWDIEHWGLIKSIELIFIIINIMFQGIEYFSQSLNSLIVNVWLKIFSFKMRVICSLLP